MFREGVRMSYNSSTKIQFNHFVKIIYLYWLHSRKEHWIKHKVGKGIVDGFKDFRWSDHCNYFIFFNFDKVIFDEVSDSSSLFELR